MEKFARRCDATGRGMNEGYVFGDGELCFSTEKHLIDHLRGLDWEDSNGKRSKDIEDDADVDLAVGFNIRSKLSDLSQEYSEERVCR